IGPSAPPHPIGYWLSAIGYARSASPWRALGSPSRSQRRRLRLRLARLILIGRAEEHGRDSIRVAIATRPGRGRSARPEIFHRRRIACFLYRVPESFENSPILVTSLHPPHPPPT